MARTLDIYCNVCNSKAIVTRTDRIHSNFNKLYCSCRNQKCQHKFVFNLEFSHSTSSSLLTKDKLLALTLSQLSKEDKEKIKKLLDEENR
ncbi:ogr/Delta-like zinc finger family protein [Pasteurella oralis]|uniref:Ogr/Delta-like zinc finger family protein n=1 Tax=Pasteurella oralis TaxID=1071947 RepID=A0ABW4NVE4_9PAST